MPKYTAICAHGLEAIVAKELDQFGASNVQEQRGAVLFEGDQRVLYKTHLWSRCANRVLFPLREENVRNPDEVYELVKSFRWESFFKKNDSFAVEINVSGQANPTFKNSHFLRLRIKDAVVDRLRDKTGSRPDINLESPEIVVFAFLRSGKITIGLDATGKSLHERKYRRPGAKAPLKETLAAGILALANWNPDTVLYDPYCGSGTLLTEAGLIAANIAPGLGRRDFLFSRWPEYYDKLWQECVEEAKSLKIEINENMFYGSDYSESALEQARRNWMAAGLSSKTLKLIRSDFSKIETPPSEKCGLIVCNPPYGERIGEIDELKPEYKAMGDAFKKVYKGWTAQVFTGSSELAKCIGLRSTKRIPLFNGPIECRLLKFELY